MNLINLTSHAEEVINKSDVVVIAVPSAYATDVLSPLDKGIFEGKKRYCLP